MIKFKDKYCLSCGHLIYRNTIDENYKRIRELDTYYCNLYNIDLRLCDKIVERCKACIDEHGLNGKESVKRYVYVVSRTKMTTVDMASGYRIMVKAFNTRKDAKKFIDKIISNPRTRVADYYIDRIELEEN